MVQHLEKEITLEAPLEKVWAVWTDVEKSPQWVSGVKESRITGEIREGLGMKWRELALLGGLSVPMEHTMAAWDLHRHAEIVTELPMGGSMRRKLDFLSASGKTRVLFKMDWDLGGAGFFLRPDEQMRIISESLEETICGWKRRLL